METDRLQASHDYLALQLLRLVAQSAKGEELGQAQLKNALVAVLAAEELVQYDRNLHDVHLMTALSQLSH